MIPTGLTRLLPPAFLVLSVLSFEPYGPYLL